MSIEQKNIVDLIGINKETGLLELAIVDNLDWNDPDSHCQFLQDKVNAYLGFIESGEIYDSYPDAKNRRFKIIVFAKYQPCKLGDEFVEKLNAALHDLGYGFQFKLFENFQE